MKSRHLVVFFGAAALSVHAGSMDAKADCDKLLNTVLPLAEQMLREEGGFHPYGGAIKGNGEIVSVAATNSHDFPPAAELIKLLQSAFIEGAKKKTYKATALVFDARIVLPVSGDKSDAIAVALDHSDNYSVVVYLPYQLSNGALSFGETIAQKGESRVFSPK